MNIENFAVLIRVNGVTKQVVMTVQEQQLFSRIVLGTLGETNGKVSTVALNNIELPVNLKAFPGDNHG
ncbi:hypothetical protein [Serratia fonticola]|uniref:hypothetical protein n=1 Tax=Serratia fonticola TaxID=47917 RepID=UPI000465132C|nr:hypothetical protein [Serratia fonticola]